jgi:MFS family permease
LALIAFMGLADRIRHRVRTYALCLLAAAAAPLLVAALAFAPRSTLPLQHLLALLMLVGVGQALVMSIPIMLDYPIIARGVSVGLRGRLFGITTTAYGILGIGIGWLSANVLKNVAYPQGYAWCFLAASGVIALRAAAYSRVRELPELAVDGASRSALPFAAIVDVLKLKEFQWLAGPHVARGLAVSVAGFALPVGLQYLGLPAHFPGYAASATTAATVLGGIAVGLIADRLGPSWTTFLGDVLYALGMATVVLFHNPTAFIALYLLMHFGRNIEDNAVPLGAINIVPAEHLGAFSAARLMVLYGSTALSAPLFGYLLEHYSPSLVFGLAAGMKLLTGVWFWWVFRLKQPLPAEPEAPRSP